MRIFLFFSLLVSASQSYALFTPYSKVLRADGTWAPIAGIPLGSEVVAGVAGEVTKVNLMIQKKIPASKVYSLNQADFQFTADQVFLTTAGYRALSPEQALERFPDLGPIGQLAVGDELTAVSGSIKIVSFQEVDVAEGTKLFALKTTKTNLLNINGIIVPGYRR